MKLVTMFLAPIVAMGMASSASARDYHDLVAEGFRWVKIDGPYGLMDSPARRTYSLKISDAGP
jgi:hypothetical protein